MKVRKPGTKKRTNNHLLFAGIITLSIITAACAGSPGDVEAPRKAFSTAMPLVLASPVPPALTPEMLATQDSSICLSRTGPRITISGTNPITKESRYVNHELPDFTIIDATQAQWLNPISSFPVDFSGIDGGEGAVCFTGGTIIGGYDPTTTTWSAYHSSAGFGIRVQDFLWESTYVENFGDGVRIANKQDEDTCQILQNANGFIIQGVYMKDMHDDCVENDWSRSGRIEDSLLEGCYVGFSTRAGNHCAAELTDRPTNVVTIQDSLIWMKPMLTILDTGTVVGNSELFKDDANGAEWTLYNNIIRADAFPIGESYDKCMGINGGDGKCVGYGIRRFPGSAVGDSHTKLARCRNNTFVWLGEGDYPPPYNNADWRVPLQDLKDPVTNKPCFTFTKDVSVWENAVKEWKEQHGYQP